jgi:hypothetical protein
VRRRSRNRVEHLHGGGHAADAAGVKEERRGGHVFAAGQDGAHLIDAGVARGVEDAVCLQCEYLVDVGGGLDADWVAAERVPMSVPALAGEYTRAPTMSRSARWSRIVVTISLPTAPVPHAMTRSR